MSIKWVGAALILTGCGGFGLSMAAAVRQEEQQLRQLIRVIGFMEAELQYRLTPLPELCALAAQEAAGTLREVFQQLSGALSQQTQPDVFGCMNQVLGDKESLSGKMRRHLRQLGRCLGRFDLPGQLNGLKAVRTACEGDLKELRSGKEVRLRSYQTLGICAGTALVILFA